MKTITKAIAGTIAAGAMAMSAMSPAMAQDRRHNDGARDGGRDGVRAGEVIAGALIVGGIAALATNNNDHRGHNDYRGRDDRRFAPVSPRTAVDQCVRAAERGASRLNGDVTDVRSVRQTRDGYEVRGRIAVKTFQGQWRGRGDLGNGWGNDRRGWNNNLRGFDAGTFTCTYERGRTNVNYNGVRGLR